MVMSFYYKWVVILSLILSSILLLIITYFNIVVIPTIVLFAPILFLFGKIIFNLKYLNQNFKLVFLIQSYFLLQYVRSFFIVSNQSDFISLVSYLPVIIFVNFSFILAQNEICSKLIFNTYTFVLLPLSFLYFLQPLELHGGIYDFVHLVSPHFVLIYYFYYIGKYNLAKLISLFPFLSIVYDPANRVFVIYNLIIVFCLFFLFYFRRRKTLVNKFIKLSHKILFIFPVLFLILGSLGAFNIFEYFESFKNVDYDVVDTFKVNNSDTRSFLYQEVFDGVIDKNQFLFGLGIYGKVKTALYTDISSGVFSLWQNGRPSSEVAILNYFQWGGAIGFFFYGFLFWFTSYRAIFKSNNTLFKVFGLWLSIKYFLSFLEDCPCFSPFTIFTFFIMGLTLNTKNLYKNDLELKNYIFNNN
jgi:hypothetical protein